MRRLNVIQLDRLKNVGNDNNKYPQTRANEWEMGIFERQSCGIRNARDLINYGIRSHNIFTEFDNPARNNNCSNNIILTLAELISDEIISKGYTTARFIDCANIIKEEEEEDDANPAPVPNPVPNPVHNPVANPIPNAGAFTITSNDNICDVLIFNSSTMSQMTNKIHNHEGEPNKNFDKEHNGKIFHLYDNTNRYDNNNTVSFKNDQLIFDSCNYDTIIIAMEDESEIGAEECDDILILYSALLYYAKGSLYLNSRNYNIQTPSVNIISKDGMWKIDHYGLMNGHKCKKVKNPDGGDNNIYYGTSVYFEEVIPLLINNATYKQYFNRKLLFDRYQYNSYRVKTLSNRYYHVLPYTSLITQYPNLRKNITIYGKIEINPEYIINIESNININKKKLIHYTDIIYCSYYTNLYKSQAILNKETEGNILKEGLFSSSNNRGGAVLSIKIFKDINDSITMALQDGVVSEGLKIFNKLISDLYRKIEMNDRIIKNPSDAPFNPESLLNDDEKSFLQNAIGTYKQIHNTKGNIFRNKVELHYDVEHINKLINDYNKIYEFAHYYYLNNRAHIGQPLNKDNISKPTLNTYLETMSIQAKQDNLINILKKYSVKKIILSDEIVTLLNRMINIVDTTIKSRKSDMLDERLSELRLLSSELSTIKEKIGNGIDITSWQTITDNRLSGSDRILISGEESKTNNAIFKMAIRGLRQVSETTEEMIIEEKKKITNLVDEYNRLYMFICYYYHNNKAAIDKRLDLCTIRNEQDSNIYISYKINKETITKYLTNPVGEIEKMERQLPTGDEEQLPTGEEEQKTDHPKRRKIEIPADASPAAASAAAASAAAAGDPNQLKYLKYKTKYLNLLNKLSKAQI